MSGTWEPKVSIIIPVYNGANYMREAIDSALAQTYPNTEVIVVNDGSRDDGETDRIARSYGERIRYIHKENGGVSSALNLGIRNMTGEYFSWLSHDDVYAPDKLRHQIEALSKAKVENAIGLCGHCFIDEHSARLSKQVQKRFTEGVHLWQETLSDLLVHGTFSGCSLLIPKAAFDACGEFHEELRFSQDALMWIKILLAEYPLVYNAHEDVYSRIHGKQLTQTGRDLFRKDSNTITKIILPDLMRVSTKEMNYLYLYARDHAKYGNREVVNACIEGGKRAALIGAKHMAVLHLRLLYGAIRPALRTIYYRICVKPAKKK